MGHSSTHDSDDVIITDRSASIESDSSATNTDSGIIEHHRNDDVSCDSCPFSNGDKVLVYHNARIYDAKVIKTRFKNEWEVFIHYLGWNKNWDEWVRLDRLLKYNEESVKKQQLTNQKDGADKNPQPSPATETKLKTHNGKRGRKRKNDTVVMQL